MEWSKFNVLSKNAFLTANENDIPQLMRNGSNLGKNATTSQLLTLSRRRRLATHDQEDQEEAALAKILSLFPWKSYDWNKESGGFELMRLFDITTATEMR